MFEQLSEKFSSIIGKLQFKTRISEKNVREACDEVRVALLEADVQYGVARDFIGRVRKRALGVEVIKGIDPGKQFIKIVNDELVDLLGPSDPTIHFRPSGPTVILMAGLQGAGKTTTTAKLASMLKKQGRAPMLVAADVQRPAAIEQLKKLGSNLDIPVYDEGQGDPVAICKNAVKLAKKNGFNTVILDTAGRLHVDDELMAELERVTSATIPSEIFLVVDAMVGQDAVISAREFNERLEISGVIMTKLDGDARGGAALSVKAITGKPIKFVGVGEKAENLEPFYPDRMAGRILGMGDIVSLVEQAQDKIDQDEAERMQKRLMENQFTLTDMLSQFRQIKNMGGMGDLMSKMPGMGGMGAGANIDDSEINRLEAILLSMTEREREHPEILDSSRKSRIARGSGTRPADVNALMKQYRMMKQMFSGKGKLASMLGGMLGGMGLKMPGGMGGMKVPKPERSAPAFGGPSGDRRRELREARKKERRQKRRGR